MDILYMHTSETNAITFEDLHHKIRISRKRTNKTDLRTCKHGFYLRLYKENEENEEKS